MARKVFISVLGTGIYGKCKYVAEGFESSETPFIQLATLEYHKAEEWGENSKIYILTTAKAKELNWNKTISERERPITKEKVPYIGLEAILEQAGLSAQPIDIPDGKDKDEMWTIFDKLFGLINDGDEIYFDLTHSFRYIPMLVLVFGNYAKFIRKAKVKAITYGNFEARENNKAPIVDLLPLSALQDWTFASADFIKNGYVKRLVEMANDELRPILRESKGQDANASNLNSFVKNLNQLVEERLMCRGLDVIESNTLTKLTSKIGLLSDEAIKPLTPVIKKIEDSFKDFDTSSNTYNAFAAAKWCFDKQLYQQATTFLEEGVISFICDRNGIELNSSKEREVITSAMAINYNHIPDEEQRVSDESLRPLLKKVMADELLNDFAFLKEMDKLMQLRNDYNHCGMRSSAQGIDKMKKQIDSLLNGITLRLFGKNFAVALTNNQESYPLFLNLSNHPSSAWSDEQLAAARQYGEVEDMEFPAIGPDADEAAIVALAEEYEKKIMDLAKNKHLTVHIMGEMTFTFCLVERLKRKGIDCVASTTNRQVEERDGQKVSTFQFVRFRNY